jgi:hypothetical protein
VLAHFTVGTIPTISYAPGTRAGLCAKDARSHHERRCSLCGLLRAWGIQPEDLFPFGVLCAPLYGLLLFFVPNRRNESPRALPAYPLRRSAAGAAALPAQFTHTFLSGFRCYPARTSEAPVASESL